MFKLEVDRDELRLLIEDALERKLAELKLEGQHTALHEERLCYSLEQAAVLLGHESNHDYIVRDMWLRGEIQTIKVGRRRCVERREILAFLRRQRVPNGRR